jgi:hypothetical protein
MWLPANAQELVNELRANAHDFCQWVDLIEGAIKDFEHAVDQVERVLPESPDAAAVAQRLFEVWAEYEARSTTDLAEAHGYIETWTRAIRSVS